MTEVQADTTFQEEIAELQAHIVDLEAQLKAGYGHNWREYYHRLRAIHVEDVRRRKEVRNFRAVNFSIAELEAALTRKRTGKPLPPKENWGGLVMSALCFAEDAIKMLDAVRKHVPEDIQKRMNVYGHRDSYYARHKRITDRFKEMQARSTPKAAQP